MEQKAQMDLLNIIFGLIVISGGIVIMFNSINLGSLLASLGLIFGLIKLVVEKGP